ncbi:MAG: hypothetical protein JXQ27_00500 [Acidobacteria bacterium]|nr:hypothetical protein [Acidobacteriota bacterium]
MMCRTIHPALTLIATCLAITAIGGVAAAAGTPIAVPFDSERWQMPNTQVTEYLGRPAITFAGVATLTDVEFRDGVIEVDMAFTGERAYPGFVFRLASSDEYEEFYIRPHRAPFYDDVLQYTPVFNGSSCWQLSNGAGYTATAVIPANEWIHVRLEVKGTQACVFLGDAKSPTLEITRLGHGRSKGKIGLKSLQPGTAWFSNFSYRLDSELEFPPDPLLEMPCGTITEWELSQPFRYDAIDPQSYPGAQKLALEWRTVQCEPDGVVNISRTYLRSGPLPDYVYARTSIMSDEARTLPLQFGYTDSVGIFLNGRLLYTGLSAYRSRDTSFLGIVGLFDSVYLPLEKGKNEVLLVIGESMGGWGFICRDGAAVHHDRRITEVWRTPAGLAMPESAVYDAKRNVVYVSNFGRALPPGSQTLTRMTPDGTIIDQEWVKGLIYPTGMVLDGDKLYVVERRSVAVVDVATGQIDRRLAIPQGAFLNDIARDAAGNLYVSDSQKHVIWRCDDENFSVWLEDDSVRNPNGLLVHDGKLLVGCGGDSSLKAVDLAGKSVTPVVRFLQGIIDGIKVGPAGRYLVSVYEGKLYAVAPDGRAEKLLDTSAPGERLADFDYIPDRGLLLVPTLENGLVKAFHMATE